MKISDIIQESKTEEVVVDEARKRKKAKSKKRKSTPNRSPLPRVYGGWWGFGNSETGADGGGE